jgi:PAS domain S-box-containing protein
MPTRVEKPRTVASRAKEPLAVIREHAGTLLIGAAALVGLYYASQYSYLLFHNIVEMFSIVVACGIFMIAWNSRRFSENVYFLFLGIAYLFVAAVDLLHTVAYPGMGVFPGYGTNLTAQLWVSSRYIESLSLFVAPLLIGRRLRANTTLAIYAAVVSLLLLSIFRWEIFPACFVNGAGLTRFKVNSEYAISAILVGSLGLLFRRRRDFDKQVLALLAGSVIVTIASELAFTLYTEPYGPANKVGHFLKIASFYLIYKAMIGTGLKKPYDFLFRNLKQSEQRLRDERNRAQEYLDIAGAMIVVLDQDRRVTLINRRGCEILGYPSASVIGRNWFDTFVPGSVREREKRRFAQLLAGNAKPDVYFECPVVCRTGEERILAWHDTILKDQEGRPAAALSSGEDITEIRRAYEKLRKFNEELEQRVIERTRALRESEERYRRIVSTAQEGIWVLDGEAKTTYLNQRMAEMLGYTVEETLGRPLFDFMDADRES